MLLIITGQCFIGSMFGHLKQNGQNFSIKGGSKNAPLRQGPKEIFYKYFKDHKIWVI